LSYDKNQVTLQPENFLIDGKIPDLVVDQLAYTCGKILYPLTLDLSPEKDIQKITNYPQIKTRWNELKNKFYHYYKDPYSQHYLQKTDSTCSIEKALLNTIKYSPFFYLYFGGIYNATLGEDFYREYTQEYKGNDFDFSQWTDTKVNEQNCFSLFREGIQENRSEKINIRYLLRNQDKIIKEAFFSFLKNNHITQQLRIELLHSDGLKTTPQKGGSQESEKLSLSFWIDEKQKN
jgi:hypothetical protein